MLPFSRFTVLFHSHLRAVLFFACILLSLNSCTAVTAVKEMLPNAIWQTDADVVKAPYETMQKSEVRARWVALRPKPLPRPELTRNPEVDRHMRKFLKGSKSFIRTSLKRREPFLKIIRSIFRDEGIPEELTNVALIESGFQPEARSPAGAVGLWQFTKSTGRVYGLEVGFFHDERKDPILSTIAAARHLRDLYNAYKDWNLVLAAYNAGSGAVDRAKIRSGSSDFWTISRRKRLPLQTRNYVPKFIAAALIVQNLEQFGLTELARELESKRSKRIG